MNEHFLQEQSFTISNIKSCYLLKVKLLLIPMLLSLGAFSSLFAQDLSGAWKGELTMRGGCFQRNYIELQLIISGSSVTGTSYQYKDTANYISKDVNGSYDRVSQTFSLQEGAEVRFQIPNTCSICIKAYRLTYSKVENIETLSGTWSGNVMGRGTLCQPGTITLSRTTAPAFKEPPRINVDTGNIRLDFYDNREIDGDSITVLVNQATVLSHQLLGTKPLTAFVRVDQQSPFQQIEMLAENLGRIPPNTALLIITAGTKRYRLFLTSTEQKSAMMRFVYEPDPDKRSQ